MKYTIVTAILISLGARAGTPARAAAQPPAAPAQPTSAPSPSSPPATQPEKKKVPMNLKVPVEAMLAERIAKQIVAASPVADPADAKARDAAAEKLGACKDLLEAAHSRILWGGFHPEQGYDPSAYRLHDRSREDFFQLTELNPMIWAKLYLSTFMFPGPYSVRQEGRFTVLELDAKFRGGLDAGEYPYPFWHSPNKWTAYMNAEKVILIFEPGRLVASMRVSPNPLSVRLIKRQWDTKWVWTNDKGEPQPRVSLFSYVFSKDNPHVAELDRSYRALESAFRDQNCMTCHAPDNQSRINDLLLLNYPNQALVMRRSLVTVLEDNQMPPGNELAHEPTGLQDPEVLKTLIKLAKEFEKQADDAFAYEQLREAKPRTEPAKP